MAAASWRPWESWLLIAVLGAGVAWAAQEMTVGWNHTISGPYQHGFRQAQTALSALRIRQGGPILAYETPVVGPPWSIPFEFPLYQCVVAAVAAVLHVGIVPAGRLVAAAFFAATLAVLWLLLGELRVKPVHRCVFLTLPVVSPVYVFWSRCVMIESTALLCAVAFAWLVFRWRRSGTVASLLLMAVSGALAAVVKATTWITPVAVAVAVIMAEGAQVFRAKGPWAAVRRCAPALLCGVVVPFIALMVWTAHSDRLKSANAIATYFQSTDASITPLLYGTPEERLNLDFWERLLHRTARDLSGRAWAAVLPLAALALGARRRQRYWISVGAFLLPLVLFMNLQLVHNYYVYANGLFLLLASGWAIEGLLEGARSRRLVAHVLLVVCAAASVYGYSHPGTSYDVASFPLPTHLPPPFAGYHAEQATDDRVMASLGEMIAAVTPPGHVIVGVGMDWTSEIPFYADRPALMIPDWVPRDADKPPVRDALARLAPGEVGALVGCPGALAKSPFMMRLVQRLGVDSIPLQTPDCAIFTPGRRGATPPAPRPRQ